MIRHAKSSWAEIGLKDFDRPLDERGFKDAPKMARKLNTLEVRPDLIVSSPAKRAYTTAQYFALGLGVPIEDIVKEKEIYEASSNTLLHIVRELPNDRNTVLMFGHNPGFTYFANTFSKEYIENVPTCGIVKIEFSGQKWQDIHEKTAKVTALIFPKNIND